MGRKRAGSGKTKCSKQKATLIVWVVRADNKALIGDARIEISGPARHSVTSAKGAHTFEQLDPGVYTIKVSVTQVKGYEKAVIVGTHPRKSDLSPGDLDLVEIEVGRAEPIEIELLDENDEGVADEPFELLTPDGRLVIGKLDRKGVARVANVLPCGDCKIRFPRRDAEFLDFLSSEAL